VIDVDVRKRLGDGFLIKSRAVRDESSAQSSEIRMTVGFKSRIACTCANKFSANGKTNSAIKLKTLILIFFILTPNG